MDILQYTFFSERALIGPTGKHPVRLCIDLHRHPPAGLHQRWHYACLFWRHRYRRICRHQPHTLCHGIRHFECLRRAMGITEERCAQRLCHRHVTDPWHERGHHLLLPYSGIHAGSALFPLRKYTCHRQHRPPASAGLTLFVALLFTFLLRPIRTIAFDSTFARSQHLPVTAIEYMMMTLIAMTIVATIKMVGIVLAISLLTIPQMTANLFTYSYKRMIGASIVIGCIDCIVGLYASYLLNVPSGATIIFVSIILFAAARILAAESTKAFTRSERKILNKEETYVEAFPIQKLLASYGCPCLCNDHSRMLYAEEYGEEQMVACLQRPIQHLL